MNLYTYFRLKEKVNEPSLIGDKLHKMIGKIYQTATPLNPAGYIFDEFGFQIDAVCENGCVGLGKKVLVLSLLTPFSVKVREFEQAKKKR